MTIAVTAASGKLGGEIARALKSMESDESVVGLARTPDNAKGLAIEVRPGDYNQPQQLEASLAGVRAVLLVSGMDAPDKRIQQHRNVIEAARAAGVAKIVYTSIQGPEDGTGFSPIVQSNRQTEADVRASGLDWSIGRNGIYIEPDVECIADYKAAGEIANCAADGRCGYTTRRELAYAYACLLNGADHSGQTYNLHGAAMTQSQLADQFNRTFGLQLGFRSMTVDAYRTNRVDDLGPFLGGVIAGIYEGIRSGAFDGESHYESAAGRAHQSWDDYFSALKA